MRTGQVFRRLVVLLVVAGGLMQSPTARADKEEARQHYTNGAKFYNLQQWQQALDEFRASYVASSDPALLFNIGQCQRALRQYEAAEQSYRAFLREQKEMAPATRQQVERLRALMQGAAERDKQDREKPPTGVASPAPETDMKVTAPPTPKFIYVERAPQPPPKPILSATGWTLSIGGVILGGIGAGLLGYASTLDSKIINASTVASQENLQSEQQRDRIGGGIAAGVGGACLVAGAVAFGVAAYRYHQYHARGH